MDGSVWLVICAMGTLLLRVGCAVYITGMVRAKNSASAIARSALDISLTAIAFWLVGGAILLAGSSRIIGWEYLASFTDRDFAPLLFFALVTTLIPGGIVSGACAERSRFFPAAALSILLGGIIIPIAWRWTFPSGWLAYIGYHDFAGAGMLHLAGAMVGLMVAIFLGPRSGKYNRDGSSNAIPGHNMPLASLGILLMVLAWFPYVLGFASSTARGGSMAIMGVNVMLAGAAGTVVALMVSQMRYAKPDVHLAYAGLLGGLVAVTAAADILPNWAAVLVGAAAGLVIPAATIALDLLWHVDDPAALIAVHGFGAIIGLISAGFFTSAESMLIRLKLIGVQCLGMIAIAVLAGGLSAAMLAVLRSTIGLRSREADEFDGLDLAEHDIGAYPDFQQTMIKSYHLREA